MNTDVQRNHKIVVGAAVAVIAVIGASVLGVETHRAVLSKSASSTAPTALPYTAPPAAAQDSGPPPPTPAAQSTPSDNTAAPAAATAAPESATRPQPTAPASTPERKAASGTAHRSSAPAPAAVIAPTAMASPSQPVVAETAMAKVAPAPAQRADDAGAAALVSSEAAAPGTLNAGGANPGGSGELSDTTTSTPAADTVSSTQQARAAGADAANPDRVITSAVQSQIAADSEAGSGISVTTVNGVVILTGAAPSTEALDHLKQAVQQVKDVKGVDTTAVKVASSQ